GTVLDLGPRVAADLELAALDRYPAGHEAQASRRGARLTSRSAATRGPRSRTVPWARSRSEAPTL
ncbi:MAG: hypothetical protein AAFZ18_27615, partial [Myxococcota bacterium]